VLLWQCEIKNFQRPVRSPAHMRPIILHVIFDLPQIQVRLPWFPQNCPDAGRASLGNFNENAFVFVRDHTIKVSRVSLYIEKFHRHQKVRLCAGR
jgi:hypothetical protein